VGGGGAGGVGFWCGAAAVNMKKPGVFGTDLTKEEYYRFAEVLQPPVQDIGVFDDIWDREYFSPGLVKKAFAGNAEAQWHLALCYDTETATPAQKAEAAYWYLQSARQGNSMAACAIAGFYLRGIAVPRSHRDALYWYKVASKKGNNWGTYMTGEFYLAGQVVKQDTREGIRWLKKASVDISEARQRLRSLGIKPPPSKYFPKDG